MKSKAGNKCATFSYFVSWHAAGAYLISGGGAKRATVLTLVLGSTKPLAVLTLVLGSTKPLYPLMFAPNCKVIPPPCLMPYTVTV